MTVTVVATATIPYQYSIPMTAVGPKKAILIPSIVRRRVAVNNRENKDRPAREWRRSAHEPPNPE
eukprot:11491237-Heterocapsa_arctica.AAC.1